MEPIEIREQTLKLLRTTRSSMMSFQYMRELEKKKPEIQRESALALSNVQLAVLKFENEELEDIGDKLKENEDDLKKGRKDLKQALENLQKIEQILKAVNSLLKVVAKVAPLLI